MKMEFVEEELNQLFKRGYWNSRYISEIRRLHNISPPKGRAKVKRAIAEKIANKVIDPRYSGSYKRFFAKGSFKPYALFLQALFTPHMERELTEVLRLVLFSDSATSTGSRKAIDLAIKAYPKAIRWNEAEAVQALKAAVMVIETPNPDSASESAQTELKAAMELLVNAEVKTSAEIISIKCYSQLSRLQVRLQGTELHDLATMASNRACYLI
jgi:hypothetical protein